MYKETEFIITTFIVNLTSVKNSKYRAFNFLNKQGSNAEFFAFKTPNARSDIFFIFILFMICGISAIYENLKYITAGLLNIKFTIFAPIYYTFQLFK